MNDLHDMLHELVADVTTPVDPAADIARGRRRLRRRNALAGTSIAAVILGAAIGGGSLFHGIAGSGGSTPQYATQSDQALSQHTDAPADTASSELKAQLAVWRDTLASYVDPGNQHLQKTVANVQTGSDSLGTKLEWVDPAGTGMVQLEVYGTTGTDWANVGAFGDWNCGTTATSPGHSGGSDHSAHGWTCKETHAPTGTTKAIYAVYPGGTAVAVKHADGTVVVIDVDQSFGDDGTTDTHPIGITKKQMVSAAADYSFTAAGLDKLLQPALPSTATASTTVPGASG